MSKESGDKQGLMTLEDVSEFLRVCPKTLRQWCWRRRIPHLKLGNLVRFERRAIEAWIKSSERRDMARE